MKKTWGEIKSEIINLGFEKTSAYAQNPLYYIEAVNRAATVIAAFVKPIAARHSLTVTDTGTPQRFDIKELTAQDGEELFLDYCPKNPVVFSSSALPAHYRIENDGGLIIEAGQSGQIDVWYKKLPAKITPATPDGHELELSFEAACLLPLLAAFYVWQDEDERKAVMYRNDYDDLRRQLMQTDALSRNFARVNGAVSGDV